MKNLIFCAVKSEKQKIWQSQDFSNSLFLELRNLYEKRGWNIFQSLKAGKSPTQSIDLPNH